MLLSFFALLLVGLWHAAVAGSMAPRAAASSIHSKLVGRHLGRNTSITEPVQQLINRVLKRGGVEIAFEPILEVIDFALVDGSQRDVFEVDHDGNGQVVLRGSTTSALSVAFGHYLKYYTYCDVHWENGGNYSFSAFPTASDRIPVPAEKQRTVFLSQLRYYQNTCTESYSFAWKDWTSWEQELDWMALNGFNLPLAFTGQEVVWQALWLQYGVSAEGLQEYFAGPAFLTWQRMANIRAFGGPLSDSWIQQQAALQKLILGRMEELGMTPVMPAFNGVVPKEMASLYPDSNITRLTPAWNDFPDEDCCNYVLPATDPLFIEVGTKFLQLQAEMFGSFAMSHVYNCDTFNENEPASSDQQYLSSASAAVYNSMLGADPEAVWLMQGWLFSYDPFWTDQAIEYYLGGVPDDAMVVLDLTSEDLPVWEKVAANNKPFIWCMLHNYGGRRALYGNVTLLATDPIDTQAKAPGLFMGTGLTMESIDQNPFVYAFMAEMAYHTTVPADLFRWTSEYAVRRYGLREGSEGVNQAKRLHAIEAWSKLRKNSYSGDSPECHHPCTRETIIEMKPQFNSTQVTTLGATVLPTVWRELQLVDQPHVVAWRYDLLDVGRQVMSNLFFDAFTVARAAFDRGDAPNYASVSTALLRLVADLDKLLATHESFLLGRWIEDARKWAASADEADLFEYNARNIITLWGADGQIDDYAAKNWGGLVQGYYLPRWQLFANHTLTALQSGAAFDEDAYSSAELQLGQAFCVDYATKFPTEAVGSTADVSMELQHSYGDLYTSASHEYQLMTGVDSTQNLLTEPMWTQSLPQLQFLCDLDSQCKGFSSLGVLKADVSLSAQQPADGVDLYIKA